MVVEEEDQKDADYYESEATDMEKDHEKQIESRWQDEDWWQMIPEEMNQPSKCLMEIGTINIHACATGFEHGATPMPKCWEGQVVRTRKITRRYRALNLPLVVNCPRCIREMKEEQ